MVAVTYGASRIPAAKAPAKRARKAAPQKNLFARFVDAMVEQRIRQAEREIMRHAHLLPYGLEVRGHRLVETSAKSLPFGG